MLRFAPSTTEEMDINTLRIALYNYMVCISKNEELVIRIEDINKKENTQDKNILEILNLFSINYKYISNQSDNLKYHSQFAMQLLLNKNAFNCFCGEQILTDEKAQAKKDNKPYEYNGFCENLSDAVTFECEAPFTVRVKKPTKDIEFTDLINGNINSKSTSIDSFIILNHDKTPTYNFACAIDDMINDISIVIRNENYLEDTLKQIYIRDLIGYDKQIQYVHLSNIVNNKQLPSVKELVESGYLPSAITNYIISMGYNSPKDIFSLEDALEWFDISKVSKESVKFDIDKLKYINKQHIKEMDDLRLSKILEYSDKDIGALAKIYLVECNTIKDIKLKINNIFKQRNSIKEYKNEFEAIVNCLKEAPFIKEFNEFEKYISKNTNLSNDTLNIPLRYVLTNSIDGPNLSEIYPLIRNYLGEII